MEAHDARLCRAYGVVQGGIEKVVSNVQRTGSLPPSTVADCEERFVGCRYSKLTAGCGKVEGVFGADEEGYC